MTRVTNFDLNELFEKPRLVAQVKQAHDVNYLLEIIFYSEEEEEKDMKKSQREPTSEVLKQAGTDFCENTSLHGFSYWVSDGKYS